MKTTAILMACLLTGSVAFARPVMQQQDTTQKHTKTNRKMSKNKNHRDTSMNRSRSDSSNNKNRTPTNPPTSPTSPPQR